MSDNAFFYMLGSAFTPKWFDLPTRVIAENVRNKYVYWNDLVQTCWNTLSIWLVCQYEDTLHEALWLYPVKLALKCALKFYPNIRRTIMITYGLFYTRHVAFHRDSFWCGSIIISRYILHAHYPTNIQLTLRHSENESNSRWFWILPPKTSWTT